MKSTSFENLVADHASDTVAATALSPATASPTTNDNGNEGQHVPPSSVSPALPPDPADLPSTSKPVSTRKREANRANAQKSTGPRTQNGKRHARTNAIRHGAYVTLPLHDLKSVRGAENLEQILTALREEYPPQTNGQAILLEEMAVAIWRRSRVVKFEAQISEHDWAFNNDRMDKAVRLCSAVHRMTEHAFVRLEQLDRQTSQEGETEQQPVLEEAAPASEPALSVPAEGGSSSRKPSRGIDLPDIQKSVR